MSDAAAVDKLVARGYQDELAQYARDFNAILAADTGTGKTLISALVIRWCMAMEAVKRTELTVDTKKVSVFLVPQVPLVEQQRLFLEENSSLEIRGYTGSMGVDGWNRSAWINEFMEADVLVMTAQIFLNILNHAHWKMSQVAVVVFDEVHNCKGVGYSDLNCQMLTKRSVFTPGADNEKSLSYNSPRAVPTQNPGSHCEPNFQS
ncbi:Dicer-like protein 1 [Serendipita sp. 400]|nr:Dicer-like protein 1 [Serendipita sp. 400]